MIRDEVIFWGAAILLVLFAFVLMPAHERFKDAGGRETDVSPDAPPKPEGLKSINARTGQREGFWSSITSFFSPSREKMRSKDAAKDFQDYLDKIAFNETAQNTSTGSATMPPLSGVTAQQSSTPPQFNTDSTLGSTTGTTGMERTLTQGDLQEAQARFIQTLVGNEPDQATKLALAEGLATLQELARSTTTPSNNVPLGSADKQVYNSLIGVPSSYTYKQFEYAYRIAGGVSASPRNIVKMLQSIPSNFNAVIAPRPAVSNVLQISQMDALAPPPDLYGPGPNVLRSALQSCSCASQTSGCPKHS